MKKQPRPVYPKDFVSSALVILNFYLLLKTSGIPAYVMDVIPIESKVLAIAGYISLVLTAFWVSQQ